MAALTAGWIDSGVTATHTLELDLEFRAQVLNSVIRPQNEVRIDNLTSRPVGFYTRPQSGASDLNNPDLGIMESYSTVESVVEYYPGGVLTQVTLNSGSGTASGAPSFLPAIAIVRTLGPLRLGVTIEARTVGGATVYYLRYGWFADAATEMIYTVDAIEIDRRSYTDPPGLIISELLLAFDRDTYAFGGIVGSSAFTHTRFSGFTANGSALSHAAVELNAVGGTYGGFFANNGRRFGPFYRWSVNLAAIDADGTAEVVDATYNGAQVTPVTVDREVEWFVEIGGDSNLEQLASSAVLADPWLSSQTIRPYASDRTFVQEGMKPKSPGNAAHSEWTVGTLEITSPVQVLLSTNPFVGSGSVVVSGATNTPTFTVSGAGSSVTKTFREHWRSWNGGALNVPGENYTATKRTAYTIDANTPDLWGWGLYAYLDVEFTAAVAATLVFEVTWVQIVQFDFAASPAIVTAVRQYSRAVTGAGTYRLDLLFPDDGDKPFYGERVDSLKVSGFATGTYTLGTVRLVTDQDAYVKYGGQSVQPLAGGGTLTVPNGFLLAQDGQMPLCGWDGDTRQSLTGGSDEDVDDDGFKDYEKDHQNGILEYAALESDPVSVGSGGGAVGMRSAVVSIQDVFTELNKVEGVTATYNGATMEADLTDAFSGVIGLDTTGAAAATPRRAMWLMVALPHVRIAANTPTNISARLVVDETIVAPGRTAAQQRIFQRSRLGMALEAQTRTAASARGGNGQTVTARAFFGGAPVGNDPSIGSGTTDAGGFVTVPIRTGEYNDAGTYRDGWSVFLEGS